AAGPQDSGFGGFGGFGGGLPAGMPDMPGMPGLPGLPAGMPRLNGPGAMGDPFSGGLTGEQRRILDYAKQHDDGAAITLAVNSPAMATASYIINTDETVIGMGGFMGADNSPSLDQLAGWVAEGKLKCVLSSAGGGMPSFGGGSFGDMAGGMQARQQWIAQ